MTPARAVTVCLYAAGLVVGMLLSLVTAFFVPTTVGPVSVGVVLAVLSIGPYVHAFGRAMRSSLAAAVPGLAWFATTMYFATKRPEGDLVVTGSVAGLLFLLLGMVSATVGIGTVRAGVVQDDRRAVLARTVQAEEQRADT